MAGARMRAWRRYLAVLTCAVACLGADRALAAGGATAVDDADVGTPGSCKVESWAAFGAGGDFIGTMAPSCVVSIFRPVEFGAQVQRSRMDDAWGTSGSVKAKINLIPSATGAIGIGLVGGLGFDLITKEHTGTFATVPFTFQLNDAFKVHLNAGWSNDRVLALNWFTWGAGVEWNIVKPVTFIAEVFGQTGNPFDPSTVTDPRWQAGLRFTPVDHIDLDVFYGRNIAGEGRNWITVGLNYRFDVPALQRR